MKIPAKRLSNGFELPVYGLGLWQMGGRAEADTSRDSLEVDAIQACIDAGITHFDTAESYAAGHAEELLGLAILDFNREDLCIASKVSPWNQGFDDLRRSFDASLKRLKLDYLDLYLLHRFPAIGVPLEETMRAMDNLVAAGLVKEIGACNLSTSRFDHLQALTSNKLVCNQVHYNVKVREAERRGVLQHCQQQDILLVAWRPLQKGTLDAAPILLELAAKYGKTPVQVALNWLISQDHVVTIAKTSSLEHLKENLGSIDWSLSESDIERIRQEFPEQKSASDAVPLDYASAIDV